MEPFAKYDFTFLEITEGNETGKYYKDYIFETSKKADRELVHYFGEQGLEHVFKIIYASETDELIAEKTFLFNVGYGLIKDVMLKNMIKDKINEEVDNIKVYIIKVHAGNYEEYEDHFEWDFNYRAFSTKEKAEDWLANVEKYIEEVYEYDQIDLFDYDSESPISFERVGNPSKNCVYDVWLGDKEPGDVHRWDKHFYEFMIEEMEVK